MKIVFPIVRHILVLLGLLQVLEWLISVVEDFWSVPNWLMIISLMVTVSVYGVFERKFEKSRSLVTN